MLAGDVSPFTIQLLFMGYRHPISFGKAIGGVVNAMKDTRFQNKYLARPENQAIMEKYPNLVLLKGGATEYTEAMGLSVLDEASQPVTPWMGCYGIGVSRLVAAIIEQRHDDKGIVWPASVAPFTVVICPIGMDRSDAVRETTESLYAALQGQGLDVLLDDRGQRPGAMFADAELIGIPYRIVIGDKALADGQVEFKARNLAEAERVAATAEAVRARIAAA